MVIVIVGMVMIVIDVEVVVDIVKEVRQGKEDGKRVKKRESVWVIKTKK